MNKGVGFCYAKTMRLRTPHRVFFLTWLLAINGVACRMLNASATPASARNPFCSDAKRKNTGQERETR